MSIGAVDMETRRTPLSTRLVDVGICDTHFHVFGPYDRFPLPASPSYAPEEATPEAYRQMADKLGVERMVVVQGGCYGADNSAMLAAVKVLGADRTRGIAVLDDSETPDDLRWLHEQGVRGIRVNAISDAGIDAATIKARAFAIADLGWHLQFHARPDQIVAHAVLLRELPVDVVIDHCGRIDTREGQDQPAMRAMLDLLESGRGWIKLIAYRCLPPGGEGSGMRSFLRRFAAAAPDRCLWGTDWPHPLMDAVPETGDLLAEFCRTLDEEAVRLQILKGNAEKLYGFQ
jgi:predicted TIM-barrel fold metal-dependent hydrolase